MNYDGCKVWEVKDVGYTFTNTPYSWLRRADYVLDFFGKAEVQADGTPDWVRKGGALYWNNKRWVVWVKNVFVAYESDYTDYNNPPMRWVQDMYNLAN